MVCPSFTDLMSATVDLMNCRHLVVTGLGPTPAPIAVESVLAWCELHAVPQGQRPLLFRVVKSVEQGLSAAQAKAREQGETGKLA